MYNNIKNKLAKKNELIDKLSSKLAKTVYQNGDAVYVNKNVNYDITLYKIGSTKNMEKRMQVYKTGRKEEELIYHVMCHNAAMVVNVIKYKLENYRYFKNKELFEGPFSVIKKTINDTINELKRGRITTPLDELLSESEDEISK
jgi:hypothetical protein